MLNTELNLSNKKHVTKVTFGDKLQVAKFLNSDETEILQPNVVPFVKHFVGIIFDEVLALKYDKDGCDIVLKETGRYYLSFHDAGAEAVVYLKPE
jgi:hypothetical protein